MLHRLRIENFALIDRLELQFGAGLNVLTGETGAGKSIVLDALDAVLGGKVSGRAVRTGTDRAVIEATFERSPLPRQTITRELSLNARGSRSKYSINGKVATQKAVQSLRSQYLEIAAQGQSLQLVQPQQQRELLDLYGGVRVLDYRATVADRYEHWQATLRTIADRRQSEQQRAQRLELLNYQLEELRSANLHSPTELEELEQEASRLNHVVDLQQQSYQAYQVLYQAEDGAPAAADLLGKAEAILTEMTTYDPQVAPWLVWVSEALVRATEAGQAIHAYADRLEADPDRLSAVGERLRQLKQLCRKYGATLPEVLQHYHQLAAEFEALTQAEQTIEDLETLAIEQHHDLMEACAHLHQMRQQAATQLEKRLIAALQPLAMDQVQFCVQITPIAPTRNGADQVTFQWSANPGEPLQPLAVTASGGEMSRFLLAFKACFSEVDPVGTLVFDEIDVGVSGRVAKTIAETLYRLSQEHQVLCVTHQPLVAAMADHHFQVAKQVIDDPLGGEERTVVRVHYLELDDRRAELAQLASGAVDDVGAALPATAEPLSYSRTCEAATAFADSLLAQAATLRHR